MNDESELYPEGSYGRAMQELEIALDGLKAEVGKILLPILNPLIDDLFDWYMQSVRRKYQVAWIAALLLLTLVIGVMV